MLDNKNNVEQTNMTTNLVQELIKEQRSNKRWKNIRFFIGLFIVFLGVFFFASNSVTSLDSSDSKGYVSLIKLDGMIESGRDFSAEQVLPLLKDAFADPGAKGVILNINSGGGTPVQASIIHDAIISFKKKYNKKVIVVGEDMLASGAYYVAVAADKIYVNPNTITGSIGVIVKGFGFPDLIKKMGIERRVFTAGANKDRLDPFLPQTKEDVEKMRTVITEVHNNFRQIVLANRKDKLHAKPEELFTGDFWSGDAAMKLGLVDGTGNLLDVLQNEFQVTRYRDYSTSHSILKSFLTQVAMDVDMALSHRGIQILETL